MSKYVVFNAITKIRYTPTQPIETAKGAKIVTTKQTKKTGQLHEFCTVEEYANVEVPMRKVKNLLSGGEVEIRADTPLCCDPSSDTYWSM